MKWRRRRISLRTSMGRSTGARALERVSYSRVLKQRSLIPRLLPFFSVLHANQKQHIAQLCIIMRNYAILMHFHHFLLRTRESVNSVLDYWTALSMLNSGVCNQICSLGPHHAGGEGMCPLPVPTPMPTTYMYIVPNSTMIVFLYTQCCFTKAFSRFKYQQFLFGKLTKTGLQNTCSFICPQASYLSIVLVIKTRPFQGHTRRNLKQHCLYQYYLPPRSPSFTTASKVSTFLTCRRKYRRVLLKNSGGCI